jgi:hypothetical protein
VSSFPSDRSSSVSVLRRFRTLGVSSPSTDRFLQDRRRVPGRLSGPRRFGTASYSHWLERRAQLSHPGLVESQRIFRARHCLHATTPFALLRRGGLTLALFPADFGGDCDALMGFDGSYGEMGDSSFLYPPLFILWRGTSSWTRGWRLWGTEIRSNSCFVECSGTAIGHPEPWLGGRMDGGGSTNPAAALLRYSMVGL